MDAIKKKMQAMKVEKDDAMDRADVCETACKAAQVRAGKAEEEVDELVQKAQKLEVDLDKSTEELVLMQEKLKEKDNELTAAELEVNNLNRAVAEIEAGLEDCDDKLLIAVQRLEKAETAGDDTDRMRKVMECKAAGDEERIAQLEKDLSTARNQAEAADTKYDEIQLKLIQTESDLEKAEVRCEVGEFKIIEMEEELRVVANNLKSLEVSEEKSNVREASDKVLIKSSSAKLKHAEARAEFAEKSVQKLQNEVGDIITSTPSHPLPPLRPQVDKLENDLVSEQEKLKAISEEVESTFVELSGY
jgi:tropomyosin-1